MWAEKRGADEDGEEVRREGREVGNREGGGGEDDEEEVVVVAVVLLVVRELGWSVQGRVEDGGVEWVGDEEGCIIIIFVEVLLLEWELVKK